MSESETSVTLGQGGKVGNERRKVSVWVLMGVYIGVGTSIVLYNKWVLGYYKFEFPITMILVKMRDWVGGLIVGG